MAALVAGAMSFSGPREGPPPGDPPASASYSQEQLDNAAVIIVAGRDLGLPMRDQTIAVMTAMGESSLRNLEYGDWETSGVTNPDGSPTTSIGLFQQQDGWGTREQRLDPYTAATLFYRAMLARVPDRDGLEPTTVAHRTQINRDPDHYAPYWPLAVALVEELSGESRAG
ncbi:MAG: peptidase M23 [Microbacterium sp.]